MTELDIEDTVIALSLKDICERCTVDAQTVIRLVNHGIVEPEGSRYSEWRFSAHSYLRIRKALRLQRDLAINEAGVALAMDLLERLEDANRELDFLRHRLEVLDRSGW